MSNHEMSLSQRPKVKKKLLSVSNQQPKYSIAIYRQQKKNKTDQLKQPNRTGVIVMAAMYRLKSSNCNLFMQIPDVFKSEKM